MSLPGFRRPVYNFVSVGLLAPAADFVDGEQQADKDETHEGEGHEGQVAVMGGVDELLGQDRHGRLLLPAQAGVGVGSRAAALAFCSARSMVCMT